MTIHCNDCRGLGQDFEGGPRCATCRGTGAVQCECCGAANAGGDGLCGLCAAAAFLPGDLPLAWCTPHESRRGRRFFAIVRLAQTFANRRIDTTLKHWAGSRAERARAKEDYLATSARPSHRHCTPPPSARCAAPFAMPSLVRVDPSSATWRAMQQTAVETVRPGAAS